MPGPEETARFIDEGLNRYAQGQPARGRKLFSQARQLDPCDPDIDNSEGIALFERGKLEEAEALFESARALAFDQLPDPYRAYAWSHLEARPYLRATYNLGLVRERQGLYHEALDLFNECLERCPNDGIGARFHLGAIHQRLGNLHQALDCHSRHCRGNLVDTPDAFYDMASALVGLNRPGEALDRLLEGLVINPHIPALLLGKNPVCPTSEPDSVDSPDWAECYVDEHGDLWPDRSRAFLRRIWDDPAVQERLEFLTSKESALEAAESDERPALVYELRKLRRKLFPGELVARLKAELIALPV